MKTQLIIIMGLALTACGGGGGGGGGSNTPSTQSVAPARSVQDLVVPDDFSYNPVVQRSLHIDISGFSTQRAHLSVYKQFDGHSTHYKANYPSKVVSTPLKQGQANVTFDVSDSQGDLLVEIWFYDGTDPLQTIIDANENRWVL